MKKRQRFIIVKTIVTDTNAKETPDYQMLQIPYNKTDETVKQEILTHVSQNHPELTISVNIYDPDNLPPNAIPEDATFSVFLD